MNGRFWLVGGDPVHEARLDRVSEGRSWCVVLDQLKILLWVELPLVGGDGTMKVTL